MTSGRGSTNFYRYTRPALVAALLLPLVPVFTTTLLHGLASASGCALDTHAPCVLGGIDLGNAYALSRNTLNHVTTILIGGWLLAYLLLIGLLAQVTIHGLRGRVVRTCAAIMSAGLMPFVLFVSSTAFAPFSRCAAMIDTLGPCEEFGLLTGIAFYGSALGVWLTNIAVPLAVLVTLLLAVTMGYRFLIRYVVGVLTPQRD